MLYINCIMRLTQKHSLIPASIFMRIKKKLYFNNNNNKANEHLLFPE